MPSHRQSPAASHDPLPPLTVKQAAERMNLAVETVYDLCKRGKLRHYRMGASGKTIRIPVEAIDDYLERCIVMEKTAGQELAAIAKAANGGRRKPRPLTLLRHLTLPPGAFANLGEN